MFLCTFVYCWTNALVLFTCVQVCNSLGQCHCDNDFSPPDCSQVGGGGSYHSNQAAYCLSGKFICSVQLTTMLYKFLMNQN